MTSLLSLLQMLAVDVVTVDNAEQQPELKHHRGVIEYHG